MQNGRFGVRQQKQTQHSNYFLAYFFYCLSNQFSLIFIVPILT